MTIAYLNQPPEDDVALTTMWARAIRLFLSAEETDASDYQRYRKARFELNEDESFIITIFLDITSNGTIPENIRTIWVDYPNDSVQEYKLYDNGLQHVLMRTLPKLDAYPVTDTMNEVMEFIEDYID